MTLLISEFIELMEMIAQGLRAEGYKVYRTGSNKLIIIEPNTDRVVTTLTIGAD